MKPTLYVSALALSLLTAGIAVAQQNQEPDLGAAARQQRAQKKATAKKVFTNDDIATQRPEPAGTTAEQPADAKAADAKTDKPAAASDAKDAKAKEAAAVQAKVNSMKAEIATLQREYDLADRENKLRVASYYADAGNSLRDPKKWAEEQRAKEAELADKKKAIDENKAKLADVLEQARKADIKVTE